jgi:hypothetical protein
LLELIGGCHYPSWTSLSLSSFLTKKNFD